MELYSDITYVKTLIFRGGFIVEAIENLRRQDTRKKNTLMLSTYSVSLLATTAYTIIEKEPFLKTMVYGSELLFFVLSYIILQVLFKKESYFSIRSSCSYISSSFYIHWPIWRQRGILVSPTVPGGLCSHPLRYKNFCNRIYFRISWSCHEHPHSNGKC